METHYRHRAADIDILLPPFGPPESMRTLRRLLSLRSRDRFREDPLLALATANSLFPLVSSGSCADKTSCRWSFLVVLEHFVTLLKFPKLRMSKSDLFARIVDPRFDKKRWRLTENRREQFIFSETRVKIVCLFFF